MKKTLTALLALLLMAVMLTGCQVKDEKTELIVFAAASLEECLTEIGQIYMAEHSDIALIFNFDSSGTLKTQIQAGAECHIFLSAGQKQMNELELIERGTRFNLLENKVVLVVPEGNPAGISSYEDLAAGLKAGKVLLAMGNSDVPVGQYTGMILEHFGLDEAALAKSGCITYGSNAKEVTTQVSEGLVDCGIIYATDAFSAGLTVLDTATEEMCGQVIYPAAMIKGCQTPEAAKEFLEFLGGSAADMIFQKVGFSSLD